jgi:hypothetical protein
MSRPVAQAERGAGWLVRPPHNLIHRTKHSNALGMRVTAVFRDEKGLPPELLKVRCVYSFLMGWRAANGAMSKS